MLNRVFKTCFQHITRNAKLSVASALIMALTFFVSSLFLGALYGSGIVLNYFEKQSQIIVFFNPDTVTNSFISQVRTAVSDEPFPLQITYVSKQEAYKIFIQFLKQDSPNLSQSVNADKLPPSLEIKTNNITDLEKVAKLLYNFQNEPNGNNIDKILYYKNVEDFLNEFINLVRFAGLVFIGFLASISLLIIWITIGIALSTHADEIEIMELVGATRSYIELPYILEGAIYGIAGSVVSMILLVVVYGVIVKFYSSSYSIFISYFKGIPLPMVGAGQILLVIVCEICIGAIVGSFGSFIAVRNKLR